MEEAQVMPEESVSSPDDPPVYSRRRLIIVVVEPGEEPTLETDPELSFAGWEIIAAMKRMSEILEEEDFLADIARDLGEDENDNGD